MDETKPCIQIINLQLDLAGKPVYRNLNMQINCGSLTALVGQNPAVWNILLRLLAGMQPVHTGQIELWGTPISQIGRRSVSNLICFIPRQHQPIFAFSVIEYIMQGYEANLKPLQASQDSDKERALKILQQLGIEKLVNRDSNLLNSAERQLVLLGRALMQDARMFLFDDPFNSLKESAQLKAMSILADRVHQSGAAAVVAMQDPWLAMQMADQLIVFGQENIAAVLYRQQPDFADAADYCLHKVLNLDDNGHLQGSASLLNKEETGKDTSGSQIF